MVDGGGADALQAGDNPAEAGVGEAIAAAGEGGGTGQVPEVGGGRPHMVEGGGNLIHCKNV